MLGFSVLKPRGLGAARPDLAPVQRPYSGRYRYGLGVSVVKIPQSTVQRRIPYVENGLRDSKRGLKHI